MPNVPLDTRFIGIAPQVNLTERKSAVLNAETQPYTVTDIANTIAQDGLTGSSFFQPEVIYFGGTSCAGIAINPYDYNPPFLASTQVLAPNLTSVGTCIIIRDYDTYINSSLQTISFPLLETVGLSIPTIGLTNQEYGIAIDNFTFLNNIDLSSLREIQYNQDGYVKPIYINSLPLLTTLNLSNLETIIGGSESRFMIRYNFSLTTIDLSSLTIMNGIKYLDFDNNALTQTTVDNILDRLANFVNLSDATINFSGGTNAAPSVIGDGYVATLVANGCTVTTN